MNSETCASPATSETDSSTVPQPQNVGASHLIADDLTQPKLELDRYPALWCSRCGWHQYEHHGPGVDPFECPQCRLHHGTRSAIRSVECVIVPARPGEEKQP